MGIGTGVGIGSETAVGIELGEDVGGDVIVGVGDVEAFATGALEWVATE